MRFRFETGRECELGELARGAVRGAGHRSAQDPIGSARERLEKAGGVFVPRERQDERQGALAARIGLELRQNEGQARGDVGAVDDDVRCPGGGRREALDPAGAPCGVSPGTPTTR